MQSATSMTWNKLTVFGWLRVGAMALLLAIAAFAVVALYSLPDPASAQFQHGANQAPVIGALPTDLAIAENATGNVGSPFSATDADAGDTITWSVTGSSAFTIDSSSGQLKVTTGLDYTGLNYEDGATRSLTVTASDGNGGTGSEAVTVTVTDEREPPGRPAAPMVAVDANSTTTSIVTWRAPTNTGPPITRYYIRYCLDSTGCDENSEWSDYPSTADTTATIANLREGETYQVRVRAKNNEGQSPWSAIGTSAAVTASADSGTGTPGGTAAAANNAPVFDGATTTRSVAENTAAAQNIGDAVAATDADAADTLTYTLGGTDAASFGIVSTTGQLQTKASLDYKTKTSYTVTVSVSDSKDADGNADTAVDASTTVTISVTNVDEAGSVSLSTTMPRVDTDVYAVPLTDALTATLTDPDGSVSSATWQWASSSDWDPDASTGTWSDISGETSAAYRLVAGDVGKYLRATASYTDPQGTGKSAAGVTANAVVAATDTDSDPVFTYGVDTIYRFVAENTAAGQNIGNAVSAIDADGDILTYTLTGTDAASFAIVSRNGQLQTKASLDYETKTSYMVTVNVSDSKGADGNADTVVDDTITVTVKVHDVHTEAPGKPNAPTVTVASTTSLNVTWTAPDNTGPAITRYTLRYCLTADNCADDMPDDWSNSDHWSNSDVTITGATATITGLTAGASYEVQVQANNDEGAGPWSAAGAGAPTALDPIGDILIFNVSSLTIPVEKSMSLTVKGNTAVDSRAITLKFSSDSIATVTPSSVYLSEDDWTNGAVKTLTVKGEAAGTTNVLVSAEGYAPHAFPVTVEPFGIINDPSEFYRCSTPAYDYAIQLWSMSEQPSFFRQQAVEAAADENWSSDNQYLNNVLSELKSENDRLYDVIRARNNTEHYALNAIKGWSDRSVQAAADAAAARDAAASAQTEVDALYTGSTHAFTVAIAAVTADKAAATAALPTLATDKTAQEAIVTAQQVIIDAQQIIIDAQQAILDDPNSSQSDKDAAQTAKEAAQDTKFAAQVIKWPAESEISRINEQVAGYNALIAGADGWTTTLAAVKLEIDAAIVTADADAATEVASMKVLAVAEHTEETLTTDEVEAITLAIETQQPLTRTGGAFTDWQQLLVEGSPGCP